MPKLFDSPTSCLHDFSDEELHELMEYMHTDDLDSSDISRLKSLGIDPEEYMEPEKELIVPIHAHA